jgi:outer membrane protein OmpA-like peptidoglycan-associated protein
VWNNGCPEIKKEDQETLNIAMRSVQFETGKAILKPESNKTLGQIVQIKIKYPDYNLSISGHTDNTGTPAKNQILSEERAKACYEFLLGSGVSSKRMTHTGYGETRPIATNGSAEGRTLNRRVEFKLVPGK